MCSRRGDLDGLEREVASESGWKRSEASGVELVSASECISEARYVGNISGLVDDKTCLFYMSVLLPTDPSY